MHTNTERVIAPPIPDVEAELDRLATRNDAERAWAVASLGDRWVLHPKYRNPPHHSTTHRTSAVLAQFTAAREAALI